MQSHVNQLIPIQLYVPNYSCILTARRELVVSAYIACRIFNLTKIVFFTPNLCAYR